MSRPVEWLGNAAVYERHRLEAHEIAEQARAAGDQVKAAHFALLEATAERRRDRAQREAQRARVNQAMRLGRRR